MQRQLTGPEYKLRGIGYGAAIPACLAITRHKQDAGKAKCRLLRLSGHYAVEMVVLRNTVWGA